MADLQGPRACSFLAHYLFICGILQISWQALAVGALAGAETVSELARQQEVSRKFVYQQVRTDIHVLVGVDTASTFCYLPWWRI
jgi:hypothetical protein